MEPKTIKHGNHTIYKENEGYIYSLNTSQSHDFNSHLHKCFEFIHIINGTLIYTVEGTDYVLSEGDFIMTKPDELHSFSFPDECEYQREFLHIYTGFWQSYHELMKKLTDRKAGYFNRISKEIAEKYGLDTIFTGIRECCTDVTPETDLLVLSYSLQLAAKIIQMLRQEYPESQEVVTNKKAGEICEYLDKHYAEELTVESVARAMYVSPSYVSRIFKRETGMTIKAYINMRRVTRAKNLIMDGRQITDVFLDCGFGDYSSFYRAFIKYAGMSPDDFKRSRKTRIM